MLNNPLRLNDAYICVGNLTIFGSDNGLSPDWYQAITWTSAGILLIGPLGTNFSEILIRIHTFSFQKMHFKTSSAKRRSFCLSLSVISFAQSQIQVLIYSCFWMCINVVFFFISIHPNLIAGNHNQVTLMIKSNGSTENEIYLCIWYHLSIMICHELWKSILRYHGHDGLSTLGASSSRGMILTFIYSPMCIHLVFLIGMLQLMLCPWALFIFFCLIYLHGWGEPICCII